MVCLAEKIGDRARRRGRAGACRRAAALRQRKMANAPFALHGNPHNQSKKCFACSRSRIDRVNAERATAINGRCYARAAAWATIDATVLRDTYGSGAVQPNGANALNPSYRLMASAGRNIELIAKLRAVDHFCQSRRMTLAESVRRFGVGGMGARGLYNPQLSFPVPCAAL